MVFCFIYVFAHYSFFVTEFKSFTAIKSSYLLYLLHDYNYLVFPFHYQLCSIIKATVKCAVKISFSYQKNKGDNSSLLCIKLSFLIRLICFCSLFILRD